MLGGDEVFMERRRGMTRLDLDQIEGLIAAAGVEGARDILNAFWRSTETLLDSVDDHLASADYSGAAAAAHALKGAAANVGAAEIVDAARAIEAGCQACDLEACHEGNDALKDAADQSRSAFDDYMDKAAAA